MRRLLVFTRGESPVVHCVPAELTPLPWRGKLHPRAVRWQASTDERTAIGDTVEEACDELAEALCR